MLLFLVASACSSLKWGFSFQQEIEVGSWQGKCWILATRLVVSDEALALQLCRKRIPTMTESSETSEVFIRRKKRVWYMWKDTQADSERESCPCGSLNHFWGHFFQVSFDQWPCWFDSKSESGLSQDISCVHAHLLAKIDFSEETCWHHLLYDNTPSLLDLQGAFLHMCSWEGLLGFENEEYVDFFFFSGQGPASSIIMLLWSFCS